MAFDPDAYLAQQSGGFDPDAYLGSGSNATLATQPSAQLQATLASPRPLIPPEADPTGRELHEAGKKSLYGAWENVKRGLNPFREDPGSLQQFKDVGVGAASLLGLPFAYPMGAATELVARPLTELTRTIGERVTPGSSVRPTHEQVLEGIRPQVAEALGAVGSRGAGAPTVVGPSQGTIANNLRLLSQRGRETAAGQVLEQAAQDPAAVRAALQAGPTEIVPGSQPTTFQQTGDLGLGTLERGSAIQQPAEFLGRRAEQNAARLQALEGLQSSGNPEAVAQHLRNSLGEIDAASDQAVTNARYNAWRAAHELGGANDPEIYGNIMRRDLQNAETVARRQETDLWNAVDPNGDLVARTGPVRGAMQRIYGEMGPAARTTLTADEQAIVNVIGEYAPSVPFREMTDLRSAVSRAMRQELMTNGRTPAYGRLSQLRGTLENAITSDVMDVQTGNFTQAAAARLAAASAATRQRAATFGAGPVKDVLRREGLEGPFRLQEGAVPGKIVTPGAQGYDNVSAFLRAVGNQEGVPVVRDSLVSLMRRQATDPDGAINPQRLAAWRSKYQDALRAMDERDGGHFSQQLTNAADASRAVGDAAAVRSRVLDEYQRGLFGKLIDAADAEDVSRTLGRVFGGDDSVMKARDLSRRLTTPEAREGARKAIVDYVRERFISNTEAGTSEQNLIRSDQFQTFMKKNRTALQQFFTPAEIDTWQAIANDLNRSNRSIASTKLPGGSNTPQDLFQLKNVASNMSLLGRALMYFMGGTAGTLHAGPFGTIAGLMGARFMIGLREAGIKSVTDLVNKAMLDPALAKELLGRVAGREKVPGLLRYSMYQSSIEHRKRQRQEQP